MKFFKIRKKNNGRIQLFLFGIKIFTLKVKNVKDYSSQDFVNLQRQYASIEKKLSGQQRLKVAFLVGLPSMFPAKPIMDRMLKDPYFDVTLVIIPDFRFGEKFCRDTLVRCYEEFKGQYAEHIVVSPYEDDKTNLKKIADVVFLPVPYAVSHEKFFIRNIIKQGILPAYVNYSFYNAVFDRIRLISSQEFGLFWKIFVDAAANMPEFAKYSLVQGKNAILTGYCKMDDYQNHPRAVKKRKTIMIAPHHSIEGGFNDIIALSNFLKYAGLFLSLPDLYPDIDFIFRPHPALFPLLCEAKFWGKKKVERYLSQLKSKSNVIYSDYGDYFQDFADSDAIIQDCGSFLSEYFYTLKPQCFMLKDVSDIESKFIYLGKKCLENSYIAYEKDDIIRFIDEVVIKGHDPLKLARENFAKNEVMLNYPHASDIAVKFIKECFQ